MKSSIVEGKTDYPCLKKSNTGLVVFFHKKECGMVVHSDGHHKLGAYGGSLGGWNETVFEHFIGTVTLEN